MACTDTTTDHLNALHKADDDTADVVTLEYAAYMN
jgi:hypothetical protein